MDRQNSDAPNEGASLPRIPKKKKFGAVEAEASDEAQSAALGRPVGGHGAEGENASTTAVGTEGAPKAKAKSAKKKAAKSSSSEKFDPPILRKGDLVRLSNEQKSGRIQGGLARVTRQNFSPDDDDEDDREPISYDIEYVLGGKLSNLERGDLDYTTATAEGLVDASDNSRGHLLRRRRAAATSETQKEQESELKAAKGKKKKKAGGAKAAPDEGDTPTKKRKGPGRPPGSKNKAKAPADDAGHDGKKSSSKRKGDAVAASSKKPRGSKSSDAESAASVRSEAARIGWERRREQEAAAKKAGPPPPAKAAKKAAGKAAAKRGSKRASDASESDAGTSTANEESAADRKSRRMDMYTRHRREMEKNLGRLEKVDRFGFFLDATPPEFDEEYDAGEVEADGEPPRKKEAVQFPDQPPFNFHIVRKRLAAGRYDLDVVALEQKRRREIKAMIDAAATSKADANEETKGENDVIGYDELAQSMCHPIAVDWETFNSDILAMCDAATARDPEGFEQGPGHLGWSASKIRKLMEEIYGIYGAKRRLEVEESEAKAKYDRILSSCGNMEAAMQGKWRKEAFPERKYERLETSSVICDGLSPKDRSYAMYELETKLPDSFVGLAYTYDDSGQHSETWMKTVADTTAKPKSRSKKKKKDGDDSTESSVTTKTESKAQRAALALAKDDGVVRAQVQTTMTTLLIQVQDKVMTDLGVMHNPEARSANWDDGDQARDYSGGAAEVEQGTHSGFSLPEVAEQEVWGMDCYTRKNVMTLIESEFNREIAVEFVEKWLLPAINACPVDLAHKMSTAARILEGLQPIPEESRQESTTLDDAISSADGPDGIKPSEPQVPTSSDPKAEAPDSEKLQESSVFLRNALESKIREHGPPWLKAAAKLIRLASDSLDDDHFRIHPKGHGSVVIGEGGLKANSLVTYYRGEVYPAWRWCEKLDAIERVQKQLDLRPNLPDFYNMAMERPKKDPRGYCLLFVDASRKSGLGSSFSHSCNPSCEVRVVSLNGKLSLSMTTLRDLEQGEELTFDYNAVTESLNEYRFAVCLCGQLKCRGSFLHYATADCYQQVLSRNSPLSARFANLVRGCMKQVMSKEDSELLLKHGFNTAAFGAVSFNHHVGNVNSQSTPDSVENVPVWLRTYVADCLRYIEYERRALPVALLCNQMERMEQQKKGKSKAARKDKKQKVEPLNASTAEKGKAIAGSKPQTSYFFFLQSQRDKWEKLAKKEVGSSVKGLEFSQAVNKQASRAWGSLGEEEKQKWKKRAIADWKKKGGKEKAKMEEERQLALKKAPKETPKAPANQNADGESKDESKNTDNVVDVEAKTISFADADAEGFSAMEQRIQQLAQSLSRVGRVLDRHRESVYDEMQNSAATADSDMLRKLVPSPLNIMSDEYVVNWMWTDSKGVVSNLFKMIEQHFPENSLLMSLVSSTKKSYPVLTAFTRNYSAPSLEKRWKHSCTGADARRLVREALLKFRTNIIDFLSLAEKSNTEARNEKRREQARAREEKKKKEKTKSSDSGASTPKDVKSEGDTTDDENMVDYQRRQASSLHYETATPLEHLSSRSDEAMHIRGGGGECASDLPNSLFIAQVSGETASVKPLGPEPSNAASAKVDSDTLLPPTKEPPRTDDANSQGGGTGMAQSSVHEDVKSLLQFSQIASSLGAIPEAPVSSRPHQSMDTSKIQTGEANQSPSKLQELIDAAAARASSGINPPPVPLSATSQDMSNAGAEPKKPKKKVVPLSEDQVRYLKDWLFDPKNILNPYPTDEEKLVMMNNLGIERKRLDGWFMKNRQRVLHPDIKPVKMVWKKHDQEHWADFRKSRYMLEATADLLLMYANTNTFFLLEPFRQFDSTPIEVYARELGNEVPRHLALDDQKSLRPTPNVVHDSDGDVMMDSSVPDGRASNTTTNTSTKNTNDKKEGTNELCSPDDVVDKVTVDYSGEYVLSQLLQWVNGGIGQKKGLPDAYGCCMLPPIQGCWDEIKCSEVKLPSYTKWNRKTTTEYDGIIRPKLAEWISDRYRRGSPWDEDVRKYFCPQDQDAPDPTLPMGSPIIDYLVTGFDDNIRRVASALQSGRADKTAGGRTKLSATDRLQSTVDEGMPAQAVANWVQCENPNCLKWRKLPWHVDVDLLPEKFFCKDNIWNPKSQACDAEEDEWDMDDAPIKFDTNEDNFEVGAWFDVQREGKVGYHEAQVTEIDFESHVKRVKFHFWKLSCDRDEWIEVGSPRIAPHHSYTPRPLDGYGGSKKKNSDKGKGPSPTPSNVSSSLPLKRKIERVESSNTSERAEVKSDGPKKALPFPQSTIDYLNTWMDEHRGNPFPDCVEKAKIVADTGLSKRQVGDWLARARKKMRDKFDRIQNQDKAAAKPPTDLRSMDSISSSPTKVENLLLELKHRVHEPPKALPPTLSVEAQSDSQKTTIKDLEAYMKTWLSRPENACNMIPSLDQKEKIIQETGIEKKRLEGWFFRARKRMRREQEAKSNSSQAPQPSAATSAITSGTQSGVSSTSGVALTGQQRPPMNAAQNLSAVPTGVSISPMTAKTASGPAPPTKSNATMTVAQPLKSGAVSQRALPSPPKAGQANAAPTASSSSSSPPSKKPLGLTEEAKCHLSRWLSEHVSNPYPSREEKDAMMSLLGILDERKLEGWFCRARKRLKESKQKSSSLPGTNQAVPIRSQASQSLKSSEHVLHPSGHTPGRHHQVNSAAPSSGSTLVNSSPFASLLNAATSELTPQSQRQAGSHPPTAEQSQRPPSYGAAHHGFTPPSDDVSSKYRNLGAREQAILSSFQQLQSMDVSASRGASEQQSYQQPYGHQQDAHTEYQSYQHSQAHLPAHHNDYQQSADYSSQHQQHASQADYQGQYQQSQAQPSEYQYYQSAESQQQHQGYHTSWQQHHNSYQR